ncbi:MAG: hypothetical protein VB099_19975 [Candidatus Limiplasma sp.]|nr:hypothetical protein [Candidatus Limiplasma sp.]
MDWKQKLTSRKLWMALAGFVGMIVVALGGAEEAATQITALIMAGASVIAYVIGEGLVDAQGAAADVVYNEQSGLTLPQVRDQENNDSKKGNCV